MNNHVLALVWTSRTKLPNDNLNTVSEKGCAHLPILHFELQPKKDEPRPGSLVERVEGLYSTVLWSIPSVFHTRQKDPIQLRQFEPGALQLWDSILCRHTSLHFC